MIDAPLEIAFGAGMAAAFNPCGFALLPAYLAFFLGTDGDHDSPTLRRVGRALAVGGAVSAGFVAVFALAGLLITQASVAVTAWTPYLAVLIGLGLAGLGVAMLRGYEPSLSLPRLSAGGKTRGLGSMAVFGISYATVSLTCTLPIFLATVSTTFRTADLASGMATFLVYALGMGAVLMVLTLAVALSRQSLVARMRRVTAWIHRISGALLVVAGVYVAYYGYYDIQINRDADVEAGPVAWVTRWSGEVSTWISDVGAVRLGLTAALTVGATVALALAATRLRTGRWRRRPGGQPSPGLEPRDRDDLEALATLPPGPDR